VSNHRVHHADYIQRWPAQRETQELVGSYGTSEFGSRVPSPIPYVIIRGYFWVCGDGLLYSLQAVRRSMLDLDLNSCCLGLSPLRLAGGGPREVRDGDDEEATSQSQHLRKPPESLIRAEHTCSMCRGYPPRRCTTPRKRPGDRKSHPP
jgi:hypothetical protein